MPNPDLLQSARARMPNPDLLQSARARPPTLTCCRVPVPVLVPNPELLPSACAHAQP